MISRPLQIYCIPIHPPIIVAHETSTDYKSSRCIDTEIDDQSFFDKNVTDVKISKRLEAVEEPESEPEEEPEEEPEMEEVNLGYTFVPYKKPAPRRGWR